MHSLGRASPPKTNRASTRTTMLLMPTSKIEPRERSTAKTGPLQRWGHNRQLSGSKGRFHLLGVPLAQQMRNHGNGSRNEDGCNYNSSNHKRIRNMGTRRSLKRAAHHCSRTNHLEDIIIASPDTDLKGR